MKNITLMISALILILLFTACTIVGAQNSQEYDDNLIVSSVYNDWSFARDFSEMEGRATDIVRVEFLDDEWVELVDLAFRPTREQIAVLWPDGDGPDPDNIQATDTIHTMNRARVIEVFKGNSQVGDIIDITQMGGRYGNRELICHDRILFESGDDLIVFLFYWGEFHRENAYAIPQPFQSAYQLPASVRGMSAFSLSADGMTAFNFNEELENFVDSIHGNPVTLTIGDLIQTAQANFGIAQTHELILDYEDEEELEEDYEEIPELEDEDVEDNDEPGQEPETSEDEDVTTEE